MTGHEAHEFATQWARDFSAKNVDSMLSHFADEVVFTSARAATVTGNPTVRSREELGKYWRAALESIETIRLTLDYVINDEPARRMAIVYLSEINGNRMRAAELLEFNSEGLVVRGEGMLGATLA
jgi:hypothetical protein